MSAPLLDPVVIQRHYRSVSDYYYVSDFFEAVERESCHNCAHRGDDPTMPSTGCPIAGRALAAYETADDGGHVVPEWYEVEAGRRIGCRGWTDRAPGEGQDALVAES